MTIVTFGEIMLRLSPPGFQRFVQARSMDVVYGGGEANVAASLAHFGLPLEYVTRLPILSGYRTTQGMGDLSCVGQDWPPVLRQPFD